MKNIFSKLYAALYAAAALLPASSCGDAVSNQAPPSVSAERAYLYAEKSVAFGERVSGSKEIAAYAGWIMERASRPGVKVSLDVFTDSTPEGKKTFRNIIAEIKGESSAFAVVGAHYDIKKFSLTKGFQGANDGASGVAALLAMLDAVCDTGRRPPLSLRFVFFDGEECLVDYTPSDGLHGSRRCAERLVSEGGAANCRAMILLDMVGDSSLCLTVPSNSSASLKKMLGRLAAASGKSAYVSFFEGEILDDHVPFLKKGIPAIDLIDFDYGPGNAFWHTSEDTLDKISGESIKTAADLALALLWESGKRRF